MLSRFLLPNFFSPCSVSIINMQLAKVPKEMNGENAAIKMVVVTSPLHCYTNSMIFILFL